MSFVLLRERPQDPFSRHFPTLPKFLNLIRYQCDPCGLPDCAPCIECRGISSLDKTWSQLCSMHGIVAECNKACHDKSYGAWSDVGVQSRICPVTRWWWPAKHINAHSPMFISSSCDWECPGASNSAWSTISLCFHKELSLQMSRNTGLHIQVNSRRKLETYRSLIVRDQPFQEFSRSPQSFFQWRSQCSVSRKPNTGPNFGIAVRHSWWIA